jgi:pilus assembly protein CpaC
MKPTLRFAMARSATAMALTVLLAAAAPAPQEFDVATGGQRFLDLEGEVARIAVADPKILDVATISPHELRLLGLKDGVTDLTVWSAKPETRRSYRIIVGADMPALRAALSDDPELRDVSAVETGKGVVLQGSVPSLDAKDRALARAGSLDGKPPADMLEVSGRRMVAVEVRFAAVSTDTLKALGINFQRLDNNFQFASAVPNSASNVQFQPGTGLSFDSGLPLARAFNLFMAWPGADFGAVISALNSTNLAQMLAEPTLLVKSGETANFLAGGEVPIPVPQGGATAGAIAIQYKKFGVQLNLQATVLANNRIVIKVNPEVSELDFSNALTLQGFNVPAIRTRSTSTTIELGDGQSFVLAGLMYTTSSDVEDKVPGLGDLPVIGTFFKNRRNARERQELIIVATPHLVSPLGPHQVPPLPGEDLAGFNPDLAHTLVNTQSLENYVVKYGLMKPSCATASC